MPGVQIGPKMERGTVRVMSFREPIRKVGMTYSSEESQQEKSTLKTLTESIKAQWALLTATLSNVFIGNSGPALEPTPTHVKSPVVVQKLWDQSAARYRYCGVVHVKVAAIFGLILDLILIVTYFVIIAMAAVDWKTASELERQLTTGTVSDDPPPDTATLALTTAHSTMTRIGYGPSQMYETYLAATIADASLAVVSVACLIYGILKNRPNFLVPEISLACVIVGVKIIQLSKQISDGVATPFVISFGMVEVFFSLWFAHVVYLYRKYMKDRNAFLAAHAQY